MLKLSDSALGAVMLALQKSLMEQTDIVPVLKGFEFEGEILDGKQLKDKFHTIFSEMIGMKKEI